MRNASDDVPLNALASRIPSALLVIASLVVTSLSVVGVFVFGSSQGYLDKISGTWTALAVDLAGGVFYRPIAGPDGFGGTRYFPLPFALHAAAIKAHANPVIAGQVLSAVTVCMLVLAVYVLLRAMDVSPLLSIGSATAILVSQTTQGALLSIRGDGLPAALNVLGIALCARQGVSVRRTLGAAGLFVLAFSAKPTSVYGAGAAVLWLAVSNRRGLAAILLTATAIGATGVVAAMQIASAGRAFDVLWVASATGVQLSAFLKAPLVFAQNVRQVPETLAFIQLGIAAAIASIVRGRSARNLAVLLFGTTLLVSVPIFAFEGTAPNHLIDINAASIVVIACYIASQRPSEGGFAVAALAIAMLAGSLSMATQMTSRESVRRYGTLNQALALIPDKQGPILAENPLVPIAAHQRVYMLDSFMFRMLRDRKAGLDEPMLQAIRRQEFAAVVLDRDPHQEPGRTLYQVVFFGGAFLEDLDQYYEVTGNVGQRFVFLPKRRSH